MVGVIIKCPLHVQHVGFVSVILLATSIKVVGMTS